MTSAQVKDCPSLHIPLGPARQCCFCEVDCSFISCMFDTKKISILFVAYCIFPQWYIVLTWVCLWMEILLVTAAITMVQSVILPVTMVTVSLDQTQGLVTWEGQMAASQHGSARKPSAKVSPSNFVIDVIIVSVSPSLWLIHTGLKIQWRMNTVQGSLECPISCVL